MKFAGIALLLSAMLLPGQAPPPDQAASQEQTDLNHAMNEAGNSAIDVEVQQFGNQVSRWDHEQAANAARKPGGQRGCGCG